MKDRWWRGRKEDAGFIFVGVVDVCLVGFAFLLTFNAIMEIFITVCSRDPLSRVPSSSFPLSDTY